MIRNHFSTVMFITANVGSIFEDPENLFQKWFDQVLNAIEKKGPHFLGIHFQEVGGKNFEESMQYVDNFVKLLVASPVLDSYDRAKIYLDEDFTSEKNFTALGNMYFIHESVSDIQQWNFIDNKFIPISGREVFSGNIEAVPTKEKCKFPLEYFPDGRWSRKGYMRTRWRLGQVSFDLINIHLFHDVSNLISVEKNPSVYSESRAKALSWTLKKIHSDSLENVPFFFFGDFNFRLDTFSLTKELSSEIHPVERVLNKKKELSRLIFHGGKEKTLLPIEEVQEKGEDSKIDKRVVLTVEKKLFNRHESHCDFYINPDNWLRKFDFEMNQFSDEFLEFDFTFPPSYPFSEDVEDGVSYMPTRCPSWCDRIVASHSARDIIQPEGEEEAELPHYDMVGREVCMGDHKPIFLYLQLKDHSSSSAASVSNPPGTSPTIIPPHQLPIVVTTPPVCPPSPPTTSTLSSPTSPRRRSCISVINGLPVAVDSTLNNWNVLDYAVFEKEGELTTRFRFSHKNRVYTGAGGRDGVPRSPTGNPSFTALVKDIVRAEGVIMAFRDGVQRRRKMSETSSESSINSSHCKITEIKDKKQPAPPPDEMKVRSVISRPPNPPPSRPEVELQPVRQVEFKEEDPVPEKAPKSAKDRRNSSKLRFSDIRKLHLSPGKQCCVLS